MGDSSDNIPGVKGVGEKTAIKLIQEFGSIPLVYENLANIKSASFAQIGDRSRGCFLSRELVTIFREVPLNIKLEDLKPSEMKFPIMSNFIKSLKSLNSTPS